MKRILALFLFCFSMLATAEEPKAETPKPETPEVKPPTPEKDPPALEEYKGRKVAQTMHYTGAEWLIRESRERQEECSKLMSILHIKEGQVVCDMGCGNGFYTLKLAPLVGKTGKVLAVDIQKEMLDMLKKRADGLNVNNIEYILGGVADPKLPVDGVDIVFMVDVYHEFDHPVEMLEHIRKSLKPKGQIILVEFRSEDPKVPIKKEHKMSKEQILKEFPINGFKLVEQFDGLPWQHVMFFERDDSALSPDRKP